MLVLETPPPTSSPLEFPMTLQGVSMILSGSNGLHMIGTAFYALKQHERNFSTSLTKRKCTFPLESVRVQWITFTW